MSGRSSHRPNDGIATLLGDVPASRAVWSRRPAATLVAEAASDGVLPLVARAAASAPDCPADVRAALDAAVRCNAPAELVREHELRRLIEALAEAGVPALLMKGADLAYSLYPAPDLRPRTDTDVLVAPDARAAATRVLLALGYDAVPQSGGDLLMYQEPFRLLRGRVEAHVVDLHWRVFNPQRYGATLRFDELARDAQPRPALAPAARGLSPVHALLLACVHRVAHHFDQPRLLWVYDVHLLARALAPDHWRQFRELALARRLSAPCLRTLVAAREQLESPVPRSVLDALAAAADDRDDRAFMSARAPHALRVLSDFRHLDSWRGRARLARQHLFPPAVYMRGVYAPGSSLPLWTLYVNRIVRGTRRWIARS